VHGDSCATKIGGNKLIPNFEGVESIEDVKRRFAAAARSIMLEHDLLYGGHTWQITALELYLFTSQSEVWRDVFTHQQDEQLNSGSWYVHDNGSRPPNYSGIDITAGSRRSGIFAGLLIRELNQEDGSGKVLQTIIRGKYSFMRKGNVWSIEEKNVLSGIHRGSVLSSPLRLVARPSVRQNVSLWCGPRWGLNSKDPHNDRFVKAPLRMATWQTKRHKERMQIFGN
jgi:hypothetical protein